MEKLIWDTIKMGVQGTCAINLRVKKLDERQVFLAKETCNRDHHIA